MDFIQWLLTGIFIYLAIGYIFVLCTEAHKDRFWPELSVILFWPLLMIIFCICCIYFGFNEMYKKIRKRKYD